jgi:hypothetical protein
LQALGAATWNEARPEHGAKLGLRHVPQGHRRAHDAETSLFRARSNAATLAEKSFLQAMAATDIINVPRAVIAQQLGVDSDALGVMRRSLMSKGILDGSTRGILRFAVPGFANFIRTNADTT